MASWYLAPSLVKLREQINAAYPRRDKSTDGAIGDAAHNARKSDHNADWDSSPPGIVRAIDVDKDLPDSGGAAQRLVDRIILDPRVAYVIFRRRIWQNPAVFRQGGWRPYTSAGKGGWFNPHEQHFHVSIRHGERFERDTSPWPIPTTAPEEDPDMTPELIRKFDDLAAGVEAAILRHAGPDRVREIVREEIAQTQAWVRPVTGGRDARGVARPAAGSEVRTEVVGIADQVRDTRTVVDRLATRDAEHLERLARIEAKLGIRE